MADCQAAREAVGKEGPRRPYSPRAQVKSTLITLHMPESLTNIIRRYAAMTGISRNHAYSDFLQQRLRIYLRAENTLMKAILSFSKDQVPFEDNHAEDDSTDS